MKTFFHTPSSAMLCCAMVLGGCTTQPAAAPAAPPSPPTAGMANPAAQYCIAQGGTLEIVRGAGGEYGVCHLADGVVMDEWALFYRDHPQKQ
jgi:uncharacterized protein